MTGASKRTVKVDPTPTSLATSTLSRGELWTTLIGFTVVYGCLAVVELGLIIRTVRRGPFAGHEDVLPVQDDFIAIPIPA